MGWRMQKEDEMERRVGDKKNREGGCEAGPGRKDRGGGNMFRTSDEGGGVDGDEKGGRKDEETYVGKMIFLPFCDLKHLNGG